MPKIPTLPPREIRVPYELVSEYQEAGEAPRPLRLADLGNKLPSGAFTAGARVRTYDFNAPTMGLRKRLGAVASRKDLGNWPGRKIAYWLAVALRELGGVPMATEASGKALDEAALRVAALPAGDVLALVVGWHRATKPSGFPLGTSGCGVCGAAFDKITVDLGDLETEEYPAAADTEEPIGSVGLIHGFPIAGVTAKTVAVRPPSWLGTFWRLSVDQWRNDELVKATLVEVAIVANDAVDIPRVPSASVDEMLPEDVDLIDAALKRLMPSPSLAIEVECPSCGARNATSIDWQDPDFFSGSSRA